jgi:hypothetical protein
MEPLFVFLDRLLVPGESHLRRVLASYAAYYNQARTHLALGKDAPPGSVGPAVRCHCRRPNLVRVASPIRPDMIFGKDSGYGYSQMSSTDPTPNVPTDQLTRALGEAVIRIWSNLPQEVQNHLFQEAVTSQGESIRSPLAVFLHDKHPRTSDPLGNPRQMPEPDSLGG